jgi:hypothetical protein
MVQFPSFLKELWGHEAQGRHCAPFWPFAFRNHIHSAPDPYSKTRHTTKVGGGNEDNSIVTTGGIKDNMEPP